jgi:hypothetical protein
MMSVYEAVVDKLNKNVESVIFTDYYIINHNI